MPSLHSPCLWPAAHPAVIGVSALTRQYEIACYANQSDIYTIGGGLPRSGDCNVSQIVLGCQTLGTDNCVSGWMDGDVNAGFYHYGIGTSFAAPVAAGVSAQLIEAMQISTGESMAVSASTKEQAATNWLNPAQIRDAIFANAQSRCGTANQGGLLYLPASCDLYLPLVVTASIQ